MSIYEQTEWVLRHPRYCWYCEEMVGRLMTCPLCDWATTRMVSAEWDGYIMPTYTTVPEDDGSTYYSWVNADVGNCLVKLPAWDMAIFNEVR